MRENGIVQRFTAPYTPQQNLSSERENRTIVEMARTLKRSRPEAKFPPAAWAELCQTAVYILNRTGKSSVMNASPIESWTGKKARLHHLRVIGSSCYPHVPKEKRRKMEDKAVKDYLIGYDGDERYRIWVPALNKIICSRDVIFDEKISACEKEITVKEKLLSKEGVSVINKNNSFLSKRDSAPVDVFDHISEENDNTTDENPSTDMDSNLDIEEENVEETSDSEERSLRPRPPLKKPKRFDDYIMLAEAFVNELEEIQEPETFEQAVKSPQNTFWKRAMDEEIISLNENVTWNLEVLPKGKRAIPCKWVFKVKRNRDGSIDKYKARLVIEGFTQRYGIDYDQTFSPVTKLGTVRSILSEAANEKMHLVHFDVCSAFLYGELRECIFMQQPQGYNDESGKVCRLNRSLYGLKQASRCWNETFGAFLKRLGFEMSEADPCLYLWAKENQKMLVSLYVDDGLVASSDSELANNFLEKLKLEFKITVKQATFFLGLEIDQSNYRSIKICQKSYAKKVLRKFGMENCRAVKTPILKDSTSEKQEAEKLKDGDGKQSIPYREAIGALMYLMVGTRPDLAFSVGILSRKLENPTCEDWVKVKRVFRYIEGSMDKGILFKHDWKPGELIGCSDADYFGCAETGRSTSGVVVLYSGGAISWFSQRQSVVATSTAVAEIVVASECAREVVWLRKIFSSITKLKETPVIFVDNTAAIKIAQNPELHGRTKHVNVRHFFIREKVLESEIKVLQISTVDQAADMMTKALFKPRLETLSIHIGLS